MEQQPPQTARMAEFVASAADVGVPQQLARSMALGLRPSATPQAGRLISKRQNSEVRQIGSHFVCMTTSWDFELPSFSSTCVCGS